MSEIRKNTSASLKATYEKKLSLYGYKIHPDIVKNRADKLRGRKFTVEHRRNLSLAMKGRRAWNKGKRCLWVTWKNITNNPSRSRDPDVKAKLSKAFSGKNNPMYGKRGPDSPAWKGGLWPLVWRIKPIPEYLEWRKAVFMRDRYTCQVCGDNKGHNLEAHHKVPFIVLLKLNKINDVEEARNCEELWNIDNGLTLCKKCHKTTPTYAKNFGAISK